MSEYSGKRIAILNTATEIGIETAQQFLNAGAVVIALDAPEQFAAIEDALGASSDTLSFISSSQGPSDLARTLENEIGALDVLICVAPPIVQVGLLDMSSSFLKDTIESELVFPALLIQEVGRLMASREQGRIIAFLSMSSKTGVHTKAAPFAAAKGGLLTYLRVAAAELAPFGVTVNSIATSLFEPQVKHASESERQGLIKGIPVRRFGRVEEAAHAVMFLASGKAGFITGETLNMSGGRFMD